MNFLSKLTQISKGSSTSNDNTQSVPLFRKEKQSVTPMTFALIDKIVNENSKKIDGVQIGKVVVVAMVKDSQERSNRTILHVSDETENGKIIQSTNLDQEIKIGEYYEFCGHLKQDKNEYIFVMQKASEVKSLSYITSHFLKVIKASLNRMRMKK